MQYARLVSTYLDLRDMIVSGEVPTTGRVTEAALAERLAVSRTPVREALRRLEGDGLVHAQGRGVSVVVLSGAALDNVYVVRAALEALTAATAAGRQAAGQLAPADLRSLRRLADAADHATRTGDLAAAVRHNRAFHRAVAELAANPVALEILDRLWDRIQVSTRRSLTASDRAEAVDTEHRLLLDRIEAGDPAGAGDAARKHVLATLATPGVG
jgi:DNA-binding GntR family transcriptional regulator